MADGTADVQHTIAASPAPAEEFQHLPSDRRREVFFQLPETIRGSLVADMSRDQLRAFVRGLDPDEVADVLGLADGETRTAVLQRVDEDRRRKAAFLLEFDPESAAGLMHLDYVTVGVDGSLEEVAGRVQRHEERTGRVPVIFVT